MDLRSIYVANGVGIFILLMLQYTSRYKILRHSAEDRVYSFMVAGVVLGCMMEALSYAVDGQIFPGSRIINYAANTYLYTFNVILPFCVIMYADLSMYGDPDRIRKNYLPQKIVGIGMIAVNIVNLFIPVSYYISEENVYERRPFGYVYFVVILYFCLSAYAVSRKYEKEHGTRSFFNIMMFLLPLFIGTALQFAFYGLSLAWLSAAVGLVCLYTMQQNEVAYIDPLVGTYNRQYLNHVIFSWIRRGSVFSGAMLDMDHFKNINDYYGHSEGDRALKVMTDILKEARIDNEWVFRFAGDEFIVLKLGDRGEGLKAYLEEVERLVKEYNSGGHAYPIALSYGTSVFENGTIDAFMKEMDDKMYIMKAEHHDQAWEGPGKPEEPEKIG